MNTAQLLSELETMTDRARLKRMVALGRLPTQEREPILTELAAGSVYERRLALFACHGSRDARRALQAAQDSSQHVSGAAGQLVALLCTEEQFITLLQTLPAARHPKLLLQWKRAGRSSVPVDGWLQQLIREHRQTEVWPVLAYGSSRLVREVLPRALEEGGGSALGRLARRHSRLLGQELLRQAEASRERTPALTYRVNSVLGLLAERVGDLAVRLVHELGRTTPLGDLTLQPLALCAPQEVAELLLASQDPVRLSLTPRLTHLRPEQITALLTQRPALFPGIAQAYARLDSTRRQALAPALMRALMNAEGILPWTVVASLPF
ncbi:hypothetical protein MF271_22450 (plasmid) [Deinococcus sp. KNUC1210]|uniref:hypothetical protein n=1 Tax=Deinococcus sp. KNUC1210 TaxID=2917691 RepID=UPI001EF0C6F8|nr:hypothetical protein [Deinococcus sp. KNUC1210]ULH18230.1 hypothetical protein MF271_22450 [Deinococcus sp. KNUC1210]